MKKIYLLFCLTLVTSTASFCQTYSFTKGSAFYANLTNPVSINNGEVWEFADYTIPIGFDFPFFDGTIDTLYFFSEGSGTVLTSSNLLSGLHKMIIPFGAALVDRGYGTTTSLSPLSYELSGTEGSRILKIEWNNAGFIGDFEENGTLTDFVNFQLWLYETTGKVETYYGPSQTNFFEADFPDVSGPAVSLIPWYDYDLDTFSPTSHWLRGSSASPTMILADNFRFLNGMVTPSTVYKFTNLLTGVPVKIMESVSVFPNPVNNLLNITMAKDMKMPVEIMIYDLVGKLQSTHTITAGNANDVVTMQVADLKTGSYRLLVKTNNAVYSAGIIKN